MLLERQLVFFMHALSSDASQGTFSKRFPLWFSHNRNYLKVFETDTRVPALVWEVLTDPAQAIAHGSVDLLCHILDNTDADIVLSDEEPRSLLEHAVIRNEGACVDYLLSREDLDVHAVILHPHRDPAMLGLQLSSIFLALLHQTPKLHIIISSMCSSILLAMSIALMFSLQGHLV